MHTHDDVFYEANNCIESCVCSWWTKGRNTKENWFFEWQKKINVFIIRSMAQQTGWNMEKKHLHVDDTCKLELNWGPFWETCHHKWTFVYLTPHPKKKKKKKKKRQLS